MARHSQQHRYKQKRPGRQATARRSQHIQKHYNRNTKTSGDRRRKLLPSVASSESHTQHYGGTKVAMLRTLWFCLAAAVEFTGGDVTIPQQFHSLWNVVERNQEDPRIAVLVGNERPQICIAQGVVHCCGPG